MKLRNFYISGLLIVILSFCVGCTHNNGDIGPFFGKWKLEKMTINGEKDDSYYGNIFWSYQSSTIGLIRVNTPTTSSDTYGNWYVDDNYTQMRISFPDDKFQPFPEVKLARDSQLDILEISGSEMILSYITKESDKIVYYFEKW